jgi:LysM repeat protein
MKTRWSFVRIVVSIPILAFAAAVLAACGERLDKNPLFKEQVRLTERLEEDAKATTWQIDELTVEVKQLKEQLAAANRGGPALAMQLKPLQDRVAALEAALAETKTQLVAMQTAAPAKRVAKRDSETPAVALESEAKPAEEVSPKHEEPENVAAAQTTTRKKAPRARVTPVVTAAREERVAPKGFYHQVARGETFETIALRNKIPIESLLAANRIPPGRDLFAGQSLYIPMSSN